jgi:hypothetical protein
MAATSTRLRKLLSLSSRSRSCCACLISNAHSTQCRLCRRRRDQGARQSSLRHQAEIGRRAPTGDCSTASGAVTKPSAFHRAEAGAPRLGGASPTFASTTYVAAALVSPPCYRIRETYDWAPPPLSVSAKARSTHRPQPKSSSHLPDTFIHRECDYDGALSTPDALVISSSINTSATMSFSSDVGELTLALLARGR